VRRGRLSLAGDASMQGNGFVGRLRDAAAIVGFHGTTTRFHRPLQPFDGFVDPLVVVLGIGKGLRPDASA